MLYDAIVASIVSGMTPVLREQIRRIARAAPKPLSEYRVAQREIHGNRFVLRASSVAVEGTWDGSAIRRILENLCGNAAKYGRPQTTITVSLIANANELVLEVHNEGDPIDDEAKIFVAFQRAEAARTQTGWGIGLALVRGLAEAHDGSVSVTSTRDAGTTLRVVLPR